MPDRDLLGPIRTHALTDDELREVLRAAVMTGIRGYREADLMLATICARHLADRLRMAGVVVQRAAAGQCGVDPN